MKLLKATALLGGVVALAASLSAQTPVISVNVPFSFVAGGYVLPAGTYTIAEPNMHGVLLLRGTQANASALVLAVSAGPSYSNNADLKFTRRGNTVVLSTVEIPGGETYNVVAPQERTASAINVALPRK